MRTLKYAILGLLSQKEMTDQEINETVNATIGSFWSTKHCQVYPEISRLKKEGLIEVDHESNKLTEKGTAALDSWLARDQAIDNTAKDIFSLRMYFSDRLDDERILELIQSQLIQHTAKQKYLEVLFKQRFKNREPDHDERGWYLILKGCIEREDFYINWLRECSDYIKTDDL